MKLISLNTWGGRAGKEGLLEFFRAYRDVDIFCLQEIWSAPYEHLEGHAAGGMSINHDNIMVYGLGEICALLTEHRAYFRPQHLNNYGLLLLIKKGFNVQHITFATPNGNRTVINFHGLWNGVGKGDSDDRLIQSDRIIELMKSIANPYLICGDFNLLPETESLKKLEAFGLRNLIKEYGITSTRTSHYTKQEKFADYTFVSEGVVIKDFKILPDEVSDHSPIYIEFE